MSWDIDYTPPPTGAKFMKDDSRMRVLMGPVGCLRGDTLIVTEHGAVPISSITKPVRVLSFDETTCQFRLSWCGGAYPKGKGNLYRVVTPHGEFVSNEHHQLLTSVCAYSRVSELAQGQVYGQCSCDQPLTSAVGHVPSLQGVDHLTQKAVSSLERYAALIRRYGLPLLRGEVRGPVYIPLHNDVLELTCLSSGELYMRIQSGEYVGHSRIDGSSDPVVHLHSALAGLTVAEFSELVGGQCQSDEIFQPMCEHHQTTGEPQLHESENQDKSHTEISSCNLSFVNDRTIVSVEPLESQDLYWDLQVLDTNNYVTVDGSVHHNSGKSVTCCFEIIKRAAAQAPGKDGKRRTRCAVVRETARQLQDTTIKTWLDWFPDGVCGRFMRTTKTFFLSIGDVECEVMFRALDDADDVANLNSLELTFAWFNECRDIHPDIVDAMSKRVGRFPSAKDGGPTWFGMWGDTNPPTMETWWYYQMEHLDPKDGVSPNVNKWAVFKQPSGRSPNAENIENLPEGYYDTTGRSEEYIRVFIDGEYGLSSAGMPIYKHFRPDYHMAKQAINVIRNGLRPVVIGIDLGLTPAAVIGQLDARGRALILAEAVVFDMGIQRFVREVLKPLLNERFAGCPVLVVTDPAGMQRAQTDERSAVDIIRNEGFRVIPARTNAIVARINAVDDFLMRQVDGDPAFLVDPGCTRLKAAMMGGYRYKERGDRVIDKNKHSHVAEALQYLMLHIGNSDGRVVTPQYREVKRVSALGWT